MADLDSALELRLSELASQLDEARRSADMAIDRQRELARENDSLKIELVKVRRKEEIANGLRDDLTRKIAAMQEELAEAKRMEEDAHIRERDLTSQNSILRGKLDRSRQREKAAAEMRDNALAINAELKDELTEWNSKETGWKNAKDELAKSSAESSALKEELEERKANNDQTMEQVRIVELACDDTLCERDHKFPPFANPLNIFEVCCPESNMSISLDEALVLLRARFLPYPTVPEWEKLYAGYWSKDPPGNGECKLCRKRTCKISEIVRHFLSQEHTEKVRARGSGVLREALYHWLRLRKIKRRVAEWYFYGGSEESDVGDQGYDDSYTECKSPRRRRYTDDD